MFECSRFNRDTDVVKHCRYTGMYLYICRCVTLLAGVQAGHRCVRDTVERVYLLL